MVVAVMYDTFVRMGAFKGRVYPCAFCGTTDPPSAVFTVDTADFFLSVFLHCIILVGSVRYRKLIDFSIYRDPRQTRLFGQDDTLLLISLILGSFSFEFTGPTTGPGGAANISRVGPWALSV